MLSVNWSDVVNILNTLKPYLIALAVIVVVALVAVIAVMKVSKTRRKIIRSEVGLAALLAITIVANLICTGPMSTLLTLVSGKGTITDKTQNDAEDLGIQIADEGIVLLKNNGGLLPLDKNKNLNVFGWASTNPCYGGTGSGALSDAYDTVDLLTGLKDAGFKLNDEISDFYKDYRADRPEVGMWEQDWTLPEPSVDKYSDSMIENAKDFSDTAMVVLTRVGGEHIDLPTDVSKVNYTDNSEDYQDFPEGSHYLELSQSERNMLDMVCENFDNVIVVYNGANTMELGFVNEYEQIKAALWCPGTGQNGFESLGRILDGEVNPSGKTADTFVADLTQTPTFNNFGDFAYDNMDEFTIDKDDPFVAGAVPHFVNYTESIYVGYRFYETAAAEGAIDYDKEVVYPFGYGLSYTTFDETMGDLKEEDGKISVDVTITNTGDVAGKQVAELYYNPPYINGGIEKASTNLAAFDKTDLLEPGESQTLTLSFNVEDMASYDYQNEKAYVLEAGDYEVSLQTDSHIIVDTDTYTVDDEVVYNSDNKRSTDEVAATNAFDFAEGDITFAGRNFEYYSEDGLLSGKIAAQAVQGAADHGVYAYIKHFAMNSQETGRWLTSMDWANEQAIREIYLKPFEIAVKEGNAKAVMSSYNYIGTQWAGACNSLLNMVLRDEWGFEGFVLTDYFAGFGYMDAERSIYNGGDACLSNYDAGTNYIKNTDSATTVTNMRRAAHNILYTVVNSRAYDEKNLTTGLLLWQIILIVVDVLLAALIIFLEVVTIKRFRVRSQADKAAKELEAAKVAEEE